MESNETEKLENLRKLISLYFNRSKSNNNKSDVYTTQVNISYYEIGCVITNMIKMCILTLDNEGDKRSSTNKNPINVSLVLEMVLEMFPINEFELLSEINQMFVTEN
ncbi:hypothetical protein [[Flexibacter] sp. ATCC 35103]|uniref:hypothetical protein n=1 Tax=[Flexibacter] sp. ATCC 35103 TaxID=1937528 RepID=UPI0009CDA548|nr:hypothetical protein [[Flexibacter] sp. ATCC 35103]OMQ11113.1 hypothetical protein BXU01_12340 [[Flexibacter] sp. ATCC 35103]